MAKKLYKIENGKKIFGVCGGLAEYFNLDVTVVRIVWVIFTLLICGTGAVVYLLCALVFPNKSEVITSDNNDDNKNSW